MAGLSGRDTERYSSTPNPTEDSGIRINPLTENLERTASNVRRVNEKLRRIAEEIEHLATVEMTIGQNPHPFDLRQFAAYLNSCRARAEHNSRIQPAHRRYWEGQEAAFRTALAGIRRLIK